MRWAALPILIALSAAASAGIEITALGYLPGGGDFSSAIGVSDNGRYVVGTSDSTNGSREAFRWDLKNGLLGLGHLEGDFSLATCASDTGAVFGNASQGFRWTPEEGMVEIGGAISGCSADGSVLSGYMQHPIRAARYTATGWTALGVPGISFGEGISADGQVIAGRSILGGNETLAFRWDAGGWTDLGHFEGEATDARAYAISGDGTVIAGTAHNGVGLAPARWTPNDGLVEIPFAPNGRRMLVPDVVSHDGNLIAGDGYVWTNGQGTRTVRNWLGNRGVDTGDWTSLQINDISRDGRTVVGYGVLNGDAQAWVAVVPEPGTLAALGMAVLWLTRRR